MYQGGGFVNSYLCCFGSIVGGSVFLFFFRDGLKLNATTVIAMGLGHCLNTSREPRSDHSI